MRSRREYKNKWYRRRSWRPAMLCLGWYEPDVLNEDGTITPGASFEQWSTAGFKRRKR